MYDQQSVHWLIRLIPVISASLGLLFSPFVFVGIFNPIILLIPLIIGGVYIFLLTKYETKLHSLEKSKKPTLLASREAVRLIIFTGLGVIPAAFLLLGTAAGSLI